MRRRSGHRRFPEDTAGARCRGRPFGDAEVVAGYRDSPANAGCSCAAAADDWRPGCRSRECIGPRDIRRGALRISRTPTVPEPSPRCRGPRTRREASFQRGHEGAVGERAHPHRSLNPAHPVARRRTVAVAVSHVAARLQHQQIAEALLVAAVEQLQRPVGGDPRPRETRCRARGPSARLCPVELGGLMLCRPRAWPGRAHLARERERRPGSSPPRPDRDSGAGRPAAPVLRAAPVAGPALHPGGHADETGDSPAHRDDAIAGGPISTSRRNQLRSA